MTNDELRQLIAAQVMPSRMETFNPDCGIDHIAEAAAHESLRIADFLMAVHARQRLGPQEK